MAPKKQPSRQPTKEKVEEKPPKPSSDEKEEDDDDDVEEQSQEQSETDDDDASSGEQEQQQQQQQKEQQIVKTPTLAPKFANGSDSESESESESEDEDVNPSAYKVQPIMPKPSPAKRAHQETDGSRNTSKKVKTTEAKKDEKRTTPTTPGTPGSGCITRLWSDEDEVAVLKGMVEFKEQKGLDPSADLAALHSFVKGKLKVDFSKDQLKSKIGRLKKKFRNASKRGEDPVFSNPHEIMVFYLAKRIWGAGAGAGNVSKSGVGKVSQSDVGKVSKGGGDANNDEDSKKAFVVRKEENGVGKEEVVVRKERGGEEFWSKYPFLRASFDSVGGNYPSLVKYDLVKEKLSLIGSDKAKELDDKWRKLIWEEAQLNYKMLGLMNEQVEMALNQ